MSTARNYLTYGKKLSRHTSHGLPHWSMAGGIYFVTFRLADSIPAHELRRVQQQYDRQKRRALRSRDPARALERARLAYFDEHIEPLLEAGHGARHLADPRVARIVADAFGFFDGQRYAMVAWVVMPTHVHVVFVLYEGWAIEQIIHSWKSFTSNEIKMLLGLPKGEDFWAVNYFDRIARTEEELWNVINYTRENPARAGLEDWSWVGFRPEALKASGSGK